MRNAIILGSGRSGTSMLAGTLAHAGHWCGPDPYQPRDSNPKGFFESPSINNINEYLVSQALTSHALSQGESPRQATDRPPLSDGFDPGQRWLSVLRPPLTMSVPATVAQRMAKLTKSEPFAFKDPRFCYTLGAWAPFIEGAARLCIFRDPAITAQSILKECRSQAYLHSLEMTLDRALESWLAMYRFVLDVQVEQGDWLFLHCDQVLSGDGLDRLEQMMGAPIARSFPETKLQRTQGQFTPPTDVLSTYQELCERAQWQPTTKPVSVSMSSETEKASASASAPKTTVSVVHWGQGQADRAERSLSSFANEDFVIQEILRPERNHSLALSVEKAVGDIVYFVNAPLGQIPNLLEKHIQCHQNHPDAGLVAGPCTAPKSPAKNPLTERIYRSSQFDAPRSNKERELPWSAVRSDNVSVRRERIDEIGGLDVFLPHQDALIADLAFRLQNQTQRKIVGCPAAQKSSEAMFDFEEYRCMVQQKAVAWTRWLAKFPAQLNESRWRWIRDLSRDKAEEYVLQRLPMLPHWESIGRNLGDLSVSILGPQISHDWANALDSPLQELERFWWIDQLSGTLEFMNARSMASLIDGWPLRTAAPDRILCWPRFDSAEDLDALVTFLKNHEPSATQSSLVLRVLPDSDPSPAQAIEKLWERLLKHQQTSLSCHILVLSDRLPEADVPRLGPPVSVKLRLPSSGSGERAQWLDSIEAPWMDYQFNGIRSLAFTSEPWSTRRVRSGKAETLALS